MKKPSKQFRLIGRLCVSPVLANARIGKLPQIATVHDITAITFPRGDGAKDAFGRVFDEDETYDGNIYD